MHEIKIGARSGHYRGLQHFGPFASPEEAEALLERLGFVLEDRPAGAQLILQYPGGVLFGMVKELGLQPATALTSMVHELLGKPQIVSA